MTKQVNQLISGALILTLAGLLSKVLSAMYRIPLQNLTGDLGFYTYQQIYPLIATVMILSLYGFPLAVSRLTAEQVHAGYTLSYRYYFLPVFLTLFVINGLLAVSLYLFAPQLAHMMQDEYLIRSLRLSALLFLLIPFLALFRGVFQATLEMKQTAYSQVIEQVIRVLIIIMSAVLIFKGELAVRFIAELGVLASLVGMLLAILVLAIFFIRRYPLKRTVVGVHEKVDWRTHFITLLTFGILAALNHLTLIFIQFIDVLTLVPQLIKAGSTPLMAMEEKGVFDRGIPLVQFGAVLGSSFALAFVPMLSKQSTVEQKQSLRDAVSLSVYLASGATVGLIVIYAEVNKLLFENTLGTPVLQVLALSIILLSLVITGSAILQAYGFVRWTVIALILSLFVKVILNYALVPLWATYGSALATVLSLFCLTVLIMGKLARNIQFSLWKQFRFLPFIGANGAMALYLLLVKWLLPTMSLNRIGLFISLVFIVSTGALIYLLVLLRYNVLDERQLRALPLAGKLMTLQKLVQHK